MKFITYNHNGKERPGVLSADGSRVHPLEGYGTLQDFIADYYPDGCVRALELSKKAFELEVAAMNNCSDFCAARLPAMLEELDRLGNELRDAFPNIDQYAEPL